MALIPCFVADAAARLEVDDLDDYRYRVRIRGGEHSPLRPVDPERIDRMAKKTPMKKKKAAKKPKPKKAAAKKLKGLLPNGLVGGCVAAVCTTGLIPGIDNEVIAESALDLAIMVDMATKDQNIELV